MRLFGRDISRYVRRIPEIPAYAGYLLKCLWLFKRPLQFILAYLASRSLAQRVVELRSGLKIYLSEHPHDVISVFVVFVREDYGAIEPGGAVVDVGANIGIFSLYAVHKKAGAVFAYEPNSESFAYLLHNIRANRLEQRVIARQFAVVGAPGGQVRFPTRSSMYNAIITQDSAAEYELVDTIGLGAILAQSGPISLLKLDCEGAEYEILFSADETSYAAVRHIRLEYHAGRVQAIDAHLSQYGFVRYHSQADTATSGNLWYERVTAG
jgi:FkbM family methyltransferase